MSRVSRGTSGDVARPMTMPGRRDRHRALRTAIRLDTIMAGPYRAGVRSSTRRDDMTRAIRRLAVAVLGTMLATSSSTAADIDRTAVDFTPPAEIKWVRNAAGTNEQAVLFGDPSKPGPYVVRI